MSLWTGKPISKEEGDRLFEGMDLTVPIVLTDEDIKAMSDRIAEQLRPFQGRAPRQCMHCVRLD